MVSKLRIIWKQNVQSLHHSEGFANSTFAPRLALAIAVVRVGSSPTPTNVFPNVPPEVSPGLSKACEYVKSELPYVLDLINKYTLGSYTDWR